MGASGFLWGAFREVGRWTGLPGPGVAEGGFLEFGQFPDSLFGEGQLAVEFRPFERFAFGRPLDFNEFAGTRHDDVEVDLGLAVFGVFEIEEGFSVMDADADGGDVRLEDGENLIHVLRPMLPGFFY